MPGVTDVVKLPDGVGVIGTTVEATQAAKNLLKVTWSDAPGAHLDSERALEEFAAIGRDKSRDGVAYDKDGRRQGRDGGRRQARVPRRIPHALRLSRPDGADERDRRGQPPTASRPRSGSAPRRRRSLLNERRAAAADRALARSRCTSTSSAAASAGAATTRPCTTRCASSKAVGKPVKLIWSREDDITFGKFRPMTAHHIEAGFDAGGKLIAWHHRVVAESVRGLRRPAIRRRGRTAS